ncbi:unnamed protein product [Cochlearia groenlandica]
MNSRSLPTGTCKQFTMRGFVDSIRMINPKRCWPFSQESVGLMNDECFSLPYSNSEHRFWEREIFNKDIESNGTKGNAVEVNEDVNSETSQTVEQRDNAVEVNENVNHETSQNDDEQRDTTSLVKKVGRPFSKKNASATKRRIRKLTIPEKFEKEKLAPTNNDQVQQRENNIEENAVVEENHEDVSQKNDDQGVQTVTTTLPLKRGRGRESKNASTSKNLTGQNKTSKQNLVPNNEGNAAVEVNADVNYETSHEDDQRVQEVAATLPLKKGRGRGRRARNASTDGSKSKNLTGPKKVGDKRSNENLVLTNDNETEMNNVIEGNAAGEVNGDVICARSHENVQRATEHINTVCTRSMSANGSKSIKLTSPLKVGNRRYKARRKPNAGCSQSSQAAVAVEETQTKPIKRGRRKRSLTERGQGSASTGAALVKDTQGKPIKKGCVTAEGDNVPSEGLELAKTTRGGGSNIRPEKMRPLSELLADESNKVIGGNDVDGIIREEPTLERSCRRQKRLLPERNKSRAVRISDTAAAAGEASKRRRRITPSDTADSSDQRITRSQTIAKNKAKKDNVADASRICSAVSSPMLSLLSGLIPANARKKRTPRRTLVAAKYRNNNMLVIATSGPSIPQSTDDQDLPNEERVDDSLSLGSDECLIRYIRRVRDKSVARGNDNVNSKETEANSVGGLESSYKSNTSDESTAGLDVVYNNINATKVSFPIFRLRQTSVSTEVAEGSSLLPKDASVVDRKGKGKMVPEDHISSSESEDSEAQNPFESSFPDREVDVSNKQPSQETAHKSKTPLDFDLNETYVPDKEISRQEDNNNNNTSRPPEPCEGSNARAEEHAPVEKRQEVIKPIPRSFQPYKPSPLGVFPPKPQVQGSSSRFPGNNSQWLGNMPTMANHNPSSSMYPPVHAYNPYQSLPPQYYTEAYHPGWSSSPIPPQVHHFPAPFNMGHQPMNLAMFPQAPRNENAWNMNFVAPNNMIQQYGSTSEFPMNATVFNNNGRPMIPFANESSVPVYQQPSFVDSRPGNLQGNMNFTRRNFPPVNQAREVIELETGQSRKTAYPPKQTPFQPYNNRPAPETSRASLPVLTPHGKSKFSFQNAQASWDRIQEKRTNVEDMIAPVQICPEKPVVPSSRNDQGKFHLLGAPSSMMLPLKSHLSDKEKNLQKNKPESSIGYGANVCNVNRNPADFYTPEPWNDNILRSEDLTARRREALKRKISFPNHFTSKKSKKPDGPGAGKA